MASKKILITGIDGLHVKPAGILANAAEKCTSTVEILFGSMVINCRSILNILSGNIRGGNEITVRCTGPDAEQNLLFITDLIERGLRYPAAE